MKNMTKIALLLLGVAVGGNGAQAQQRVVAYAGQDYTIEDAMSASGNNVTYRWFRDGVPIENATGATYTIPANLAKHENGIDINRTSGARFQRSASGIDCAGGVAMSNEVVIYFCELIVNGVCWAKANSDNYGRINPNPWDIGYFYQWNKPLASYSPTSPGVGATVPGWPTTPDAASTWTNGEPCTAGWRLPTVQDFQNLHATSNPAGGVWVNGGQRGVPSGTNGRFYGHNSAYCTMSNLNGCIFLPAAGIRNYSNGSLSDGGVSGRYTSNKQSSPLSRVVLAFDGNGSNPYFEANKVTAYTIRCVQDVQ